jgi:hypothetical protein
MVFLFFYSGIQIRVRTAKGAAKAGELVGCQKRAKATVMVDMGAWGDKKCLARSDRVQTNAAFLQLHR